MPGSRSTHPGPPLPALTARGTSWPAGAVPYRAGDGQCRDQDKIRPSAYPEFADCRRRRALSEAGTHPPAGIPLPAGATSGQSGGQDAPGHFGELIRDLRSALGWSQGRLASELCRAARYQTVTRECVSRWEHGKRLPGPFWMPHLAGVLQAPLQELARAKMRRRDLLRASAAVIAAAGAALPCAGIPVSAPATCPPSPPGYRPPRDRPPPSCSTLRTPGPAGAPHTCSAGKAPPRPAAC